MTLVNTKPNSDFVDGVVDLDYRDPAGWRDTFGGKGVVVLFGDEECGPFAFFSSMPPSEEMMPTGFAHAHGSDNWRISVRGTTNMGHWAYEHGEFRFHDGGKPYPGDNVTWGPDGGFGIVMFGDRRGFAINPVKEELGAKVAKGEEFLAGRLGIDMVDPCPSEQQIVTTLGRTSRSHLNGGFDGANEWPEMADGVRFMIGLMGDVDRGPIVLLVDADPNTAVLPERSLATEAIAVPLAGSAQVGDATIEQGSIRIEAADTPHPRITAGDDGIRLAVLLGDRRAVLDAIEAGTFGDEGHGPALTDHLRLLLGELAAA